MQKLDWLGFACLYFAAGYICTHVWIYGIRGICNKRLKRVNYLGRPVPTAMGLSISLAIGTVLCLQPKLVWDPIDAVGLGGVWIASAVGILDDLANEKEVKGLRSHFTYAYRYRQLTSGGLKAVVLTLGSVWLAREVESITIRWMTDAAVIALLTNFMNLLDLRPGRTIKASLSIVVLLLFGLLETHQWSLSVSSVSSTVSSTILSGKDGTVLALLKWMTLLMGCVIAYAPNDFRGNTMLGDTGANMIGMVLGFLIIQSVPYATEIGILIMLVLLHIYAERYSISKTIEAIPALKWVDRIGIVSISEIPEQTDAHMQTESVQEIPQP